MGKVIRLTESQLKSVIKKVIKEQQDDLELRSATQELNQKTGENISTDEVKDAVCTGGDVQLDMSQVPQEMQQKAQTAFQQLKAKVRTASAGDLIKALRDLRKLARQGQQQTNEQDGVYLGKGGQALAGTVMGGTVAASILGVPMTLGLATAIFGSGLLLILYALIVSIRGERNVPRSFCSTYKPQRTPSQMRRSGRSVSNVGMSKVRGW